MLGLLLFGSIYIPFHIETSDEIAQTLFPIKWGFRKVYEEQLRCYSAKTEKQPEALVNNYTSFAHWRWKKPPLIDDGSQEPDGTRSLQCSSNYTRLSKEVVSPLTLSSGTESIPTCRAEHEWKQWNIHYLLWAGTNGAFEAISCVN